MSPIHISKTDHGQIRVFAVNRSASALKADLKTSGKSTLASQMLGRPVSEPGFELFPLRDLSGIGLSGYLHQGHMVPDDQLAPQRARLDALEGYVLLLFSSAFSGQDVTLDPGPDLTLIAQLGEIQPDMSTRPIESAAAQPYTGIPRTTPNPPNQTRASGSLMILIILTLLALFLWWILTS